MEVAVAVVEAVFVEDENDDDNERGIFVLSLLVLIESAEDANDNGDDDNEVVTKVVYDDCLPWPGNNSFELLCCESELTVLTIEPIDEGDDRRAGGG